MISITADPTNSDRVILTQTVTLYLDRLALETLSAEVAQAIRERAASDLRKKSVRKAIADEASRLLLRMLIVNSAPTQEQPK